jgi:hypothetical protein
MIEGSGAGSVPRTNGSPKNSDPMDPDRQHWNPGTNGNGTPTFPVFTVSGIPENSSLIVYHILYDLKNHALLIAVTVSKLFSSY